MGSIARQSRPQAGPEILVLDRTSGDFLTAATYAIAAADAKAIGEVALDMADHSLVVVTLEVTVAGSATELIVAVRSSDKPGADVLVETDWSRMNRTADIDKATGFDTTQALEEHVVLTATKVGRYTISLPVTNRFVSVVVWADASTTVGRVFMSKRP